MSGSDHANLQKALGRVIAQWLADNGLSERDLARMCGKSNSTIASWVKGERAIGIDNLFNLAQAMRIPPPDLIKMAIGDVADSLDLRSQIAALPLVERIDLLHWMIDEVAAKPDRSEP